MTAIGSFLLFLLDVAFWIIIIQVVLSWLITFEVINIRNPQAANFVRLIDRITAPVFNPLRKLVPPIAGIDVTPIIVIFAIYLLKSIVASVFFG
ncbi:MAG: YggT family protein [Micavibrio aeruginosavorus]|uniref:YggT family protein n=1 Tax=Micavibrio aeruginosavorus TaxID=349221 RepID=A0A2W5BZ59_9BACT|nr:MAG: YggT family protein [Micavibrio aeruginosavorus]